MPIAFYCPCKTLLHAPDGSAGRPVRCGRCGTMLIVPGPVAEPDTPRSSFPLGIIAVVLAVFVLAGVGVGGWVLLNTFVSPRSAPSVAQTHPEAPPAPRPPPTTPSVAADSPEARARDHLNALRAVAGLPPVAADPELCRGCLAHARYVATNSARLGKPGFSPDEEDESLPGFSEDGRRAAAAGILALENEPLQALDGWTASLFMRFVVLDPELQRVGWGQAQTASGRWVCVLDAFRGRGTAEVIVYPIDGQTAVPLEYPGNEVPDPIPEAEQKRAGYPVTVTFPRGATVKSATASLRAGGADVPSWISTPERPAQDAARQANTVCLIAKEPLRPQTAYTVTATARVNDEPWERSWTFTTSDGAVTGGGSTVLDRVNAFRRSAGLGRVEADESLTSACRKHAEYLLRNSGHPATQGLAAHGEDPKLPGYSEEGHRAGQASDIAFGVEPLGAVDAWMASFFHRVPLLDPALKRVGLGTATDPKRGPISVLDVQSGTGSGVPIVYPADGQTGVQRNYKSGERPDPIPESKDRKAGFPVTVTFPRTAPVKDVTARLTDADGRAVDVWLSTPERSADADLQRNSVGLIAKESLRPETAYTATVTATVRGQPWSQTWKFTTGQ
jgi:uncharacterized protein YkwD